MFMKRIILSLIALLPALSGSAASCALNAAPCSGSTHVLGKKRNALGNTRAMRVSERHRSPLRQIWYIPGKWLIFWNFCSRITRSVETEVSVQNRFHSMCPSSSNTGRHPSSSALLYTTSYLQLVRLMYTHAFGRRRGFARGAGAASLI